MDNFLYYVLISTCMLTQISSCQFDLKWQVQCEKFMKKELQHFPPCHTGEFNAQEGGSNPVVD